MTFHTLLELTALTIELLGELGDHKNEVYVKHFLHKGHLSGFLVKMKNFSTTCAAACDQSVKVNILLCG